MIKRNKNKRTIMQHEFKQAPTVHMSEDYDREEPVKQTNRHTFRQLNRLNDRQT